MKHDSRISRMRVVPRWVKTMLLVVVMSVPFALAGRYVAAQTSGGLGVGRGDGLEVGINLAGLNQISADINAGMYDRPCTPQEHDSTRWHTLVNVERKCHYDHMHGDDPTTPMSH